MPRLKLMKLKKKKLSGEPNSVGARFRIMKKRCCGVHECYIKELSRSSFCSVRKLLAWPNLKEAKII